MAKRVPKILAMVVSHVEAVGYSVHATTDTAGELDIVLTINQYHSIRAQLADNGFAFIPTGEQS